MALFTVITNTCCTGRQILDVTQLHLDSLIKTLLHAALLADALLLLCEPLITAV